MHLGQDHLEAAVHQRVHLLGIAALGERDRVDDVGEQHGHVLALTLDGAAHGQDPLREMLRRVGDRRGPDPSRRRGQRLGAGVAEALADGIRLAAGRAADLAAEGRRARSAEPRALAILVAASRAGHARRILLHRPRRVRLGETA